jgi:hypothetical protein
VAHATIFGNSAKPRAIAENDMQPEATAAEQRRTLCDATGVDATVNTHEAALMLGVTVQSLRRWSCRGNGPIRPRHVAGRLRWAVADISALLASKSSAA